VPVPRRFDRRPPERDTTRINERIRVPEVRVIGDDGGQVGVMKIDDALKYAQERDLDLVEVAPDSKPPVCRVLDYSKYKYELAQKQKAARKHQKQIVIREIKFRPKIAEHDYATKKGHVQRFLRHRDKVKITIMFRGREQSHPERGKIILDRLATELEELAQIEQRPNLEGRNMTMVLGPSKAVLKGDFDDKPGSGEPAPDAELTTDVDGEAPETDAPETDAVAEETPVAEAAEAEAPADVEAPADAPADADAEAPADAPA
jgi:translation initiation factor IF-3